MEKEKRPVSPGEALPAKKTKWKSMSDSTKQRRIRQPIKSEIRFKRYRNQAGRRHFKLDYDLMMSELGPVIGPLGVTVYSLLGAKKTGKMPHDERLFLYPHEVEKWMSEPTLYKMLFRLRAYRLIAPMRWGRKGQATEYKIIRKWRTLISMPDKLERIYDLVREHEALLRVQSSPGKNRRRRRLRAIQDNIFKIIV